MAQSPALRALSAPRFVENDGQWNSPERFRLQAGGIEVFLEGNGWSFRVKEPAAADEVPAGAQARRDLAASPQKRRSTALRMSFVGGRAATMRAEQPSQARMNFLAGGDRAAHRHDVASYASVLYEDLQPGVDVRARSAGGHFEYDLLVAPDAPLAQIAIRVDGAESLQLNDAGELVLHTALGNIVQPRPSTWMVAADGSRVPVACDYELIDADTFRFVAPDRDASRPLVVDPPLIYSSYLGGTGEDLIRLITEDSQGRILVCGQTDATDFPVTLGGLQTSTAGSFDGFIACIDPTLPIANQLVFSTYFGGTGNDNIGSICELANGNIAFGGFTQSLGLPTTVGAFQANHGGGLWDGMYGTIDATGATLLGLTYFGGSNDDFITTIHEHPSGLVAFCGSTLSTDMPVVGSGFQTSLAAGVGRDGMYGLIDPTGNTVIMSSYLGGSGDEWAYCGELDANGVMAIFGGTASPNFPVSANAYQATFQGGASAYWWAADAYVALIDPMQSGPQQLVYGSYFGSTSFEDCYQARFASNGDVVLMGTSAANTLPTTANAHQQQHAGGGFINGNYIAGDAYVARLDPTASGLAGLVYCTYLGGNQQDQGIDFAIASDDSVTVCGWTRGTSGGAFSTTPDAMRRVYAFNDGYVAHLSADGSQLLYATLLGGTDHDGSWLIHQHADGIVNIGSATFSTDYPIENPAQATFGGSTDVVVTRMRTIPEAVTRYGAATPQGSRKPTIHAMSDAVSGNAAFGLACSKAPANGVGILAIAANSIVGVPVLGINLLLDPGTIAVTVTVTSAGNGESVTLIPLPTATFGTMFAQYAWLENAATVALSASDALQLF